MAITRLGPNQDITAAKIAGQINFKNLIINGDMSIAQRGTSASSLTVGGYSTHDRWLRGMANAGTWTQSQDTDVPTGQGFAKSLKLDCTTASASLSADANLNIGMRFEGQMLQQLKYGTSNAESLTLSFWVKSTKTGTFYAEFYNFDDGRHISKSYTVNASDTWEKKTITFAGDIAGTITNDNTSSLYLLMWLVAGSNYTSGTHTGVWETTVNANRVPGQVNCADSTSNNFWITGVQLEADTSASDFEFLPWDINFARCLRYYEKSYDYGTTAGTSTEAGTSSLNGLSTSSKQIRSHDTRFTVQKRTDPTVTIYDKSGNSGKWTTYDSGGGGTDNATYSGVITKNTKSFDIYASNSTAAGYQFHYTADAEL